MSTGRFYTGRNVKGQALDISFINSRTLKRACSEQALDELIGPYIYIYIYKQNLDFFKIKSSSTKLLLHQKIQKRERVCYV